MTTEPKLDIETTETIKMFGNNDLFKVWFSKKSLLQEINKMMTQYLEKSKIEFDSLYYVGAYDALGMLKTQIQRGAK